MAEENPLLLHDVQAIRLGNTITAGFGATATTVGTVGSRIVRVNTSVAVMVLIDGHSTTTAATDGGGAWRLPADGIEYVICKIGETVKVKAADSASAGVLGRIYVTDVVGKPPPSV